MKKILSIVSILLLLCAGTLWAADSTHRSGTNYSTSGGEKWVVGGQLEIEDGGYITGFALKVADIAMTGVDYTLSAAEALCNILVVTGSPSGQAIIAPSITGTGVSRLYTVRNAGSDSGTVTLKKSGGTGVAVAAGKTAEVYWLGTDYVRKTADATH